MMQMYVKDSKEALIFYQKAFNAEVKNLHKDDEGNYIHAELNVYGQIIALSEVNEERISGNTMQFCLHFEENETDIVEHAYKLLQEGAEILSPLGPNFYSKLMTDLIDQYGIRWCLFV
jgi:PhnB protein